MKNRITGTTLPAGFARRIREIQFRTGWTFAECLRLTKRGDDDDVITNLIKERDGKKGDW